MFRESQFAVKECLLKFGKALGGFVIPPSYKYGFVIGRELQIHQDSKGIKRLLKQLEIRRLGTESYIVDDLSPP